MKKTGDFLRKAREDKGLSIHEIGLSLKINPKILKQIEDGDKDNLPAKTFLRGFVQSYALFLKINPDDVLKIFSDEMGTTKPNQISLTSGPQIRGNSIDIEEPENKDDLGIKRHTGHNFNKEKFEFKNIGIGIVVFVLLLSLIAVRKVVEKYQKEAEVDVATTEENLKTNSKIEMPQAPAPVTAATTPEVKPTTPEATTAPTDVKAQAAVAATTTAVTNPGPTTATNPIPPTKPTTPNAVNTKPTEPPGAQAATNPQNPGLLGNKPTTTAPATKPPVTPPVATNTNKPVVTPTPSAATTPAIAPKPAVTTPAAASSTTPAVRPATTSATPNTTDTAVATPKPPEKPKNVELVIEAFETVEIEMIQSTGKVEKIKMAPSQIQTFKTVSGVKLNISNGGAVNLIVNGKDMGVPGDLGKPKRVSF